MVLLQIEAYATDPFVLQREANGEVSCVYSRAQKAVPSVKVCVTKRDERALSKKDSIKEKKPETEKSGLQDRGYNN